MLLCAMFTALSLLYRTHRLLRIASSPSFTNHVALTWYREYSKMLAYPSFVPYRNSLIGPHFLCHKIVTKYPLMFRPYCTSEEFESIKPSSTVGTDHADEVYKTVLDHAKPEYKMEGALDELGIELITPLVVEVLDRLRFEEKLAFRFFNWAGHQEHYSHEPESYNRMIEILSSTKYKVRQFRIICDLRDYMKRSDKSSVPIEVLLTILRWYTEKHLTHLQKFAKKKKISVKTQPEINAFNLLLDAMCKCSLIEDAEAMYQRVRSKVKPNADTYNILFFGWCRVRNPTKAMGVLENMISMGLTPEYFTYNTAIDTFCKAGMLKDAAEILQLMKTKGSTMQKLMRL
ncbi:pentatricopeptide repeat-containing protein, mitochondrial [Salvia divinorum]|uniref:Pentatricopeptide repeat-containing protein, mitochondrial n=1 Tax=Salvia divinorum TaxID=28513 RepID=A0ABD1GEP7_SALDI